MIIIQRWSHHRSLYIWFLHFVFTVLVHKGHGRYWRRRKVKCANPNTIANSNTNPILNTNPNLIPNPTNRKLQSRIPSGPYLTPHIATFRPATASSAFMFDLAKYWLALEFSEFEKFISRNCEKYLSPWDLWDSLSSLCLHMFFVTFRMEEVFRDVTKRCCHYLFIWLCDMLVHWNLQQWWITLSSLFCCHQLDLNALLRSRAPDFTCRGCL